MLELLLFRHAKSRWDQPGVEDHERDLAPRGEVAAPRMGDLLADKNLVPDGVLCSTALRAVGTWQLAGAKLKPVPAVAYVRELYLASPTGLLEIVRGQDGPARRLMVIGHNPGIHAFALDLTGDRDPAASARLSAKFPTAAVAHLTFAIPRWADLAPRSGKLQAFWRPRDLA